MDERLEAIRNKIHTVLTELDFFCTVDTTKPPNDSTSGVQGYIHASCTPKGAAHKKFRIDVTIYAKRSRAIIQNEGTGQQKEKEFLGTDTTEGILEFIRNTLPGFSLS